MIQAVPWMVLMIYVYPTTAKPLCVQFFLYFMLDKGEFWIETR